MTTPLTYTFTYAAISGGDLLSLTINGGLYGALNYFGNPTVDGTNSTLDNDNASSELHSLETFKGQVYTYLTTNGFTQNTYDGSVNVYTVSPIQSNNWYTFNIPGTPTTELTIEFDGQGDSNSVFYIYNTAVLNLLNCTFSLINQAQYNNIYVMTDSFIKLKAYDSNSIYYGNFIIDLKVQIQSSVNIIGTLSTSDVSMVNGPDVPAFPDVCTVTFSPVVPCFLSGTKILTDRWYVPVEELKEGDMVITHGEICDNKYHIAGTDTPVQILHVHKHTCSAGSKTSPIVVTKNAFGANKPFEDLYVSKNHGLLDRKGRLYPSSKFVNGGAIYQDPTMDHVTYYHIELASHYAITANGITVESYLKPEH